MRINLTASILALVLPLTGCNKAPEATKNTSPIEAVPFKGQVYRSLKGNQKLILISETECELNLHKDTFLCKYTKQPDALRVVLTVLGSTQVLYYRLTAQGLEDKKGEALLDPDSYAAAEEAARVVVEYKKHLQREAEEQKLAEEQSKRKGIERQRSNFSTWLRTYFAKGQSHEGEHWNWNYQNPPFKFTLTMTADPIIKPTADPEESTLEAFGKLHWHGRYNSGEGTKENPKYHEDQDRILVKGTLTSTKDSPGTTAFLYLSFLMSDGKEYAFDSRNRLVVRDEELVFEDNETVHLKPVKKHLVDSANEGNEEFYCRTGKDFCDAGNYAAGVQKFQEAVKLGGLLGLKGLAWHWATCRDAQQHDGKRAVATALQMMELSLKETVANSHASGTRLDVLAAAYARNGQFKKAIEKEMQAIATGYLPGAEMRLELYRNWKAYQEPQKSAF